MSNIRLEGCPDHSGQPHRPEEKDQGLNHGSASSPPQHRVWIAEGVETALSLKMAGLEGTILASQGIHNMKNYAGPATTIILCGDHDGPTSRTADTLSMTAEALRIQGHAVQIITPRTPGHDFNDTLRHQSVHALRDEINHALNTDPIKCEREHVHHKGAEHSK